MYGVNINKPPNSRIIIPRIKIVKFIISIQLLPAVAVLRLVFGIFSIGIVAFQLLSKGPVFVGNFNFTALVGYDLG